MMRSPSNWSVAVRTPAGEIAQVSRPIRSAMARHRLLRLPVVRGVVALGESLAIGFRALAISANYAAQEEGEDGEPSAELSRGQIIFAFALAIGFALTMVNLVGIPVTNMSANPARSIGPAIFAGGWALAQLWVFIVAPLAGAALAAAVDALVRARPPFPAREAERALPSEQRARYGLKGETIWLCRRPAG